MKEYIENFIYFSYVVMAEKRIKVLLMVSIVIVCLTGGSILLKVTTDPVEIWASPTSRSRQEKDFFDKYFSPFYRTNQLFIKTVGIESVRTL